MTLLQLLQLFVDNRNVQVSNPLILAQIGIYHCLGIPLILGELVIPLILGASVYHCLGFAQHNQ